MNCKKVISHKIKILTLLMLFLAVLFCSLSAGAVEQKDSGHPAAASHQTEHSGAHNEASGPHTESESAPSGHGETDNVQKDVHHEDDHNGQIPVSYYIYWLLLTVTFIIACFYCLWVYRKGKPLHESLWLARGLIVLAISLYTIDQFPWLKRHFDQASHQFVDGYHEPTTMGVVKLFYKLGLGVLLMVYGLIGRKEY